MGLRRYAMLFNWNAKWKLRFLTDVNLFLQLIEVESFIKCAPKENFGLRQIIMNANNIEAIPLKHFRVSFPP
jgi:hypothetical protein